MLVIKWICRPRCLVGLAMLFVIAGLVFGLRAFWKVRCAAHHLAQGRLALDQGDTDEAWAEFSEAIRLDPRSVEARREHARLAIRCDRWEVAIDDMDAALEQATGDAGLYILRAESHVGVGGDRDRPDAFDRAVADADAALGLDARQPLAYCQRALANCGKFNNDQALADVEEARRQAPGDARVLYTRGKVYAARGELEKACADLSEAIRLDPNHAKAFALRGTCRSEMHDHAAALADCNHAVEVAPRGGWAYSGRSLVHHKDRGCTLEMADLDRALELNPYDIPSYLQRAVCHVTRHEIQRALADCAAALAINPDSSLALAVRSVCHLVRGRKKGALADMETAVRRQPDSPPLRLASAAFYQEIDEVEKALAECDRALKGAATHKGDKTYLLRAVCFLQKGDSQHAIADCDRVLKLDPKSVEAYAIRSVAHSRAGNANAGRCDFDAALRLDRGKAYQFRAETFNLLKLNDEVIADLSKLITLTPKEPDPYQLRAAAYLAPLLEPAAMGVGTSRDTLIISLVLPDMPAGKAGVQVGDKIIRVGSLRPTQFNQVVDHVATFRAGASVELEVQRNGKSKVFPLVLAKRPLDFRAQNPSPGRKMQAERALDDCQRAVERDPKNPAGHRLLAEAYHLLDRHEEAIKSATEALRLDPDDPLMHLSRARAYLARNENDQAIAEADKALGLESEGGLPYLLRGLAYAEKQQQEQAKSDFAEAARLNPKLAVVKEEYERQLAPRNPAPLVPHLDRRLPPITLPEPQKPGSKPIRWPSGDAMNVILGIGAVIFLVALIFGYLRAKKR